ncbi:MAG: hypothetical protein JO232_02250 [Verrucomicrobia bacterium]|nr:hypothetical protein [Verrucomicrobiota bacterium]
MKATHSRIATIGPAAIAVMIVLDVRAIQVTGRGRTVRIDEQAPTPGLPKLLLARQDILAARRLPAVLRRRTEVLDPGQAVKGPSAVTGRDQSGRSPMRLILRLNRHLSRLISCPKSAHFQKSFSRSSRDTLLIPFLVWRACFWSDLNGIESESVRWITTH